MNVNDDKWIKRFFGIADQVASWSKDTSTKVGAYIVTVNGEPVSHGTNGMPIGVNDDAPERHERPTKYLFFEHAERNAIYLSSRSNLKDCVMFVTHPPCADCARGIIQKGIKQVYVAHRGDYTEKFKQRIKESYDAAQEMFLEAGVKYQEYPLND